MPTPTFSLPVYPNIPLPTITWMNENAVGGAPLLSSSAPTSSVYTTANRAMLFPFLIYSPVTIYKFFTVNGTVINGSFDMCIYSRDYKKLIGTGPVVQSGTSVIQNFPLAAAKSLYPDQYYMGISYNNTSGTFFSHAPSSGNLALLKCGQMANAFPLPDTFVPVALSAITGMNMPIFGAKLVNV